MSNPNKNNNVHIDNNIRRKTSFNFGVKGWLLLFYCCLGWMFLSGAWWNGAAGNIMISIKAEQIYGLSTNTAPILAWNSIIGFCSVILILGIGVLTGKFKTRIVSSIVMIVGGIAICFYGSARTIGAYFITFLLIDAMANSTATVALPQIITQWFPTKKGSALGWATIGANLAALVTFTIFGALIERQGVVKTNIIFGVATIVMGLINMIFITNDPEKRGFKPDNGDFTPEEYEAHKKLMSGPYIWKNWEAMRDKNFWCIAIGYGALMMCSTGFLQQFVPYQISMYIPTYMAGGADLATATALAGVRARTTMRVLPALALPGSIFSGWLDQKIGTRRTGLVMGVCYVIAGLCAGLLPFNNITNYIFVFLFFFWTGANANLSMSHAASVFGPRDYPHVWGRMACIVNLFRVVAALILSWGISNFARVMPDGTVNNGYGLRAGYTVFFVITCIAVVLIFLSDSHVEKVPGQRPTVRYKN